MARPRLVGSALLLLTLAVYLPVCRYGFIRLDDFAYIAESRMVRNGLTVEGLKWAFAGWHVGNYHPLTWISHMLDCEIFGLDAGPQHMVNLLFHAANVALLFGVLRRITGALWPSAIVAALFGVHPAHVESVAWLAERKDVLSTFFWALTLYAYSFYTREVGNSGPAGERRKAVRRKRWFYAAALTAYALAILSKPMVVTLPLVMLLLDWWPLRRAIDVRHPTTEDRKSKTITEHHSWRWLLVEKAPFFLLSFAGCVTTFLAQREEAVASLEALPLGARLANVIVGYVRYMGIAIRPTDLAIFYPMPKHIIGSLVAAAGVFLATVSWFTWRTRQGRPWILVGWLWFLGTLIPVIGLVQAGSQSIADRYTYVPFIGLFLAAVFEGCSLLSRFSIKPAIASTGTALLLTGLSLATERQIHYWRSSESVFVHALDVTTDNPEAHFHLGSTYSQLGRHHEALQQYKEAVRLAPNLAEAHNGLGNALDKLEQPEDALVEYREALRLNPESFLFRINLGALLSKLDRYEEAFDQFNIAARERPDDPRPIFLSARADLRRGQNASAISHFHAALAMDPNDPQMLMVFARVQAAIEVAAFRNGVEALRLAERANVLTGGSQYLILDTLAMAYAENGRFEDAQQLAQFAIELGKSGGQQEDMTGIEQRLKLYTARTPYREDFAAKKSQEPPRKKNGTL